MNLSGVAYVFANVELGMCFVPHFASSGFLLFSLCAKKHHLEWAPKNEAAKIAKVVPKTRALS
jgi:hypothetical protein